MRQYIIEHWLLNNSGRPADKSLSETQVEQSWARLGFATLALLFLSLHGANFEYYRTPFLITSGLYFLANIISLFTIRKNPLSALRTISMPVLDVTVVSFGMLVDGGGNSGIYFAYLLIIFGNGFRFGNSMLLYTQVMSMIGLTIMAAVAALSAAPIIYDPSLLYWQLITLLLLPAYVYMIGKRTEKAIKAQTEAEEASFNLLDQGPVPVFTFELDQNGKPMIVYTNKAIHELFQMDHAMLAGEGVDRLILPEDSSEMFDFCARTLDLQLKDENNTIYIRGINRAGTPLKLTCTAIPVRWRTHRIGVCFIVDITQRETLQEQLEAVHKEGYMSTLVAGVVHDFRNVLNNMIGYAELLRMESDKEDVCEQLDAIIAAGDRGSELITRLLKLGKNNKNNIPLQIVRTSGESMIKPLENITGLARLQLPARIQMHCRIDHELPDVAITVIELEQMLLNLINNAMQSIQSAGLIQVTISSDHNHHLAIAGMGALSIRVSDDGPGIAPENIDLIFKPFWTSRSNHGGSGLGLAMVQRIVKRHHGTINVASVPYEETTFTIVLPPFREHTHAATIAAPTQAPASIEVPPPMRILLIDDAAEILRVHQAMLMRLGHTVETAENGLQALETFSKDMAAFDLIITDFHMPVMDGLALTEEIRAVNSHIPILMVTAYGEDQRLQQSSHHHIALLGKPVTMDKFNQGIIEAIRIVE
ncbi:response regulator [Mariprofundus erugo]|uniref:hybrid sensor histidine kinase/response regulator n=1 Tax=Mariprofundus erugo TaxID=2528639 RepID=UPI0010FEF468|nr:ATP-binding protein [Mariprofundus erugo]TLS76669.1 response regulator [Mariprofundus erugo]